MSHFGNIGHHLIVAIIDHIPNGWVMFNGDMTNDPCITVLYFSYLPIASCQEISHSADPEGEDTAALAGSTVVEEDALSFPTLIPVSLGQLRCPGWLALMKAAKNGEITSK